MGMTKDDILTAKIWHEHSPHRWHRNAKLILFSLDQLESVLTTVTPGHAYV